MGFRPPKTDTCATCDKYLVAIAGAATPEEKDRLEEEKKAHHIKADFAYEAKHQDKQAAIDTWADKTRVEGARPRSKDCVDVITFDYQQNLETPMLQHNDIFYLHQM